MTLHDLRPHLLPAALALFALILLGQITGLAHTAWRTAAVECAAREATVHPPQPAAVPHPEDASRYARLAERGLFTAPKQPGPSRVAELKCIAVLGDAALVNNRWGQAGDRIENATVLAVHSGGVEIDRDGTQRTLAIFPELKPGPGCAKAAHPPRPGV